MVVLIRSNEVNPDPRLQKYIDYLESLNKKYTVIGWNRSGVRIEKGNHIYFNMKAKYGDRYKNIPKKIKWFIFIFRWLIENKNKYSIIHACDLDTAIPAYISKKITKKKMIFDIFDVSSDISKKGILNKLIELVENYIANRTEYLIICEEERKNQIKLIRDDIFVMPNIPSKGIIADSDIIDKIKEYNKNYKLSISYVGVFDRNRGIEDILNVVSKNSNIILHIAGFGHLKEYIKNYSYKNNNIIYWGKVDYNIGLNIMKHTDVIMAAYYLSNPLHKFAAPNKYYEGLMLGKPIITTENTLVGERTKKYDTGFVVSDDINELSKLLNDYRLPDKIKYKNYKCDELWKSKYKDSIENFMKYKYSFIIK